MRFKLCGRLVSLWAAAGLLLGVVAAMGQGNIRYEADDLQDVIVGEDLWEYRFYLSGFNFQANQGLSVFFNYQTYTKLAHPNQPSLDPVWNILVVQPDVLLTDPGFFDALATAGSPSFAVPFQVHFVWLGVGTPAEVPYYTYDSNFQILFQGTTSLVPEPGTWALITLGGAGWLVRRWSQRKQKR
jgi:hypothetical protein